MSGFKHSGRLGVVLVAWGKAEAIITFRESLMQGSTSRDGFRLIRPPHPAGAVIGRSGQAVSAGVAAAAESGSKAD